MSEMFLDTADGGARMLGLLSPQDFLEFRLFDALGHDVFVCSPTGLTMRLDVRWIGEVASGLELSLGDIERVLSEHPEFPKMPESFYEAFNLDTLPHKDLLDEAKRLGVTAFEAADRIGVVYRHKRLPLWYERAGYTISLKVYDYCVDSLNFVETSDFAAVASLLRSFEGWSLCVERQGLQEGWRKRIAADAQRLLANTGRSTDNTGGRPDTLRADTQRAYDRLFPKGHEGQTWPQVLRQVNSLTGHTASVDTLKRAVADRSSTAKASNNL